MLSFSSYLRIFVVTAALLMSGVVITNLIVNPFAVFQTPEFAGINARKTEFFKHIRLVKAYQLRNVRPDVILAGNSRVDMAFDPQHPALTRYAGKAYNSALAGATIYEVLRYLQHAHRLNPVKLVVVGLDRSMFEFKAQPDFDEAILASSLDGRATPFPATHLVRTAMSLDTLIASGETLGRQQDEHARQYRSDGMRLPENAERAIRVARGHRVVFSRELTTRDEYAAKPKLSGQYEQMFGYFQLLLKYCRAEQIELILFIHPLHAWDIENEWLLGRGESGEEWKRELVKLIADEAGASGVSFPLWDFGGYNTVTMETVPPEGDTETVMRYYWEPRHYKKLSGDLILDRVLNYRSDTRSLPGDFGVLLSQTNVDRVIAQARAQRHDYQQRYQADTKEIGRRVIADKRF